MWFQLAVVLAVDFAAALVGILIGTRTATYSDREVSRIPSEDPRR